MMTKEKFEVVMPEVFVVFATSRFQTTMMRIFSNRDAAEDLAAEIRAGRHNLGEGWEAFVTSERVYPVHREGEGINDADSGSHYAFCEQSGDTWR